MGGLLLKATHHQTPKSSQAFDLMIDSRPFALDRVSLCAGRCAQT